MGQVARRATIALYTDYESDERGEYTFVLGGKSGPATDIPDGSVLKTVPAGRYAVFTPERGPIRLRSYIADFEVYDQRAADPANAVVEIYVGVK